MQPCECGGRRFSVPTSFRGTTDIELDQDDHEEFDILDTDQGDGEWEENSTVRCIECDKQIPYAQWVAEEVEQPDTSAVPVV